MKTKSIKELQEIEFESLTTEGKQIVMRRLFYDVPDYIPDKQVNNWIIKKHPKRV